MSELDTTIRSISETKKEFYKKAFNNPVTSKPYLVPEGIRKAAIHICDSYGIRGECDPMYVANTIALELGLGDGRGNFF